jgi:hypothetical protein
MLSCATAVELSKLLGPRRITGEGWMNMEIVVVLYSYEKQHSKKKRGGGCDVARQDRKAETTAGELHLK